MRKRNITKIGEIQERSIKGKNKKKKTEGKGKEKQNVQYRLEKRKTIRKIYRRKEDI